MLHPSTESITNSSLFATLIIKVNIGILYCSFRKWFCVHQTDHQGVIEKDTGFGVQGSLLSVHRVYGMEVGDHHYSVKLRWVHGCKGYLWKDWNETNKEYEINLHYTDKEQPLNDLPRIK